MKRTLLNQLLADQVDKRPVALATLLSDGRQCLVYPTEIVGDELPTAVLATARQYLADDRSGALESDAGRVFIQAFNPPLRLIIIGAVHIAQALVPLARLTGYDVTVIDPLRAWTSDTRFPEVAVSSDWPDDALVKLAPDARTAIVTLSHDPKLDDPALQIALRSPAFYIGALGSRKTHAGRLQRLGEAGFASDQTARIHAPIGLAIGAQSPAEIALAIMAEVVQVLRKVNA